MGPKVPTIEAVAIYDPASRSEVTSAEGIRKASLDYCTTLLTNRDPVEEFKVDIEVKAASHKQRMLDLEVYESDTLSDMNLLFHRQRDVKTAANVSKQQKYVRLLYNLTSNFLKISERYV